MAAVGVRSCSPAGRFANFCDDAAEAGVAIIYFVNDAGAGQDVAPPGAIDRRLATNPIAIGVPRRRRPHLVVDMSTSVVAAGRIAESLDRNETLPAEWVNAAGALRPVGGLKGFGLALVAESLAGALAGAGTVSADPTQNSQGALVLALNIEAMRPLTDFALEVDTFIDYVRDVSMEPGAPPLHIPGEHSASQRREHITNGLVLNGATWRRLQALSADLEVAMLVSRRG